MGDVPLSAASVRIACVLVLLPAAFACHSPPAQSGSAEVVRTGEPPRIPQAPRIDALVASAGSRADGPAVVVLVARKGEVIFEQGYGLANIASARPATPATQFYIASNSKAFTAMAIMMLAERGKLSYDDPLTKFFPQFPPYAKRITVRHLLHHTSGIRDYGEDFDDSNLRPGTVSKLLLAWLAERTSPVFPPGTRYEYSNSGYFLLAMIADKVSGQRLPEFLRANVFDPLGMKHTFVTDEYRRPWPDLATPYVRDGGRYHDAEFGANPSDLTYGDGGVVSTVGDLFLWDQALDTDRLVKPATLAEGFTTGKTADGEAIGYGFGWELDEIYGYRRILHSGMWNGWNSAVVRYPDERSTVIVLSSMQPFGPTDLADEIAELFFEEE